MSNLGPLTTTYIPGPGCDVTLYGKIYSSMSVRDKYHSLGQTDTTSCYPSSFAARNNWYSPGLCPSAWSSACGNVRTDGETTETRVTCCPSGYICATSTDSPWNTFSCSRLYVNPVKVIVPQADGTKTNYMETTLGASVLAYADAVQIRYQKTDFASTTASLSMTIVSAIRSETETRTMSSASPSRSSDAVQNSETPVADEKKDGGGGGLSAGAYAGIGVGVAAVLVIAVCAILWTWKGRRRQDVHAKDVDGSSRQGENMPEMDVAPPVSEIDSRSPMSEVGQRDAGELRGDTRIPAELDSREKARMYQLE